MNVPRRAAAALLLAASSLSLTALPAAAVAVAGKDGEGRHRGSSSIGREASEKMSSESTSKSESKGEAGRGDLASASAPSSSSSSSIAKHFAAPQGNKDDDIDKINRMMDLFASVPETLEDPEARALAHHLEDIAVTGGDNIKKALEEASHHTKASRAPHLMRRGGEGSAPHSSLIGQSGKRPTAKASDALLQTPSGMLPPLPNAYPAEDDYPVAAMSTESSETTPHPDAHPDATGVTFTKVYTSEHVDVPIPDISHGFDLETLEKHAQTTLYPPWWSAITDSEDDVTVVTSEATLPEPEYWIEDGCRFGEGTPLKGNYSGAKGKLAYAQCCSTGQGATCTRKSGDACFKNWEPMTFYEAKQVCEDAGMRLCSKTELHDSPDALGCCGGGCGLDDLFVWTETMSDQSEWVLNKRLTKQVNGLRNKNLDLLREHLSTELRLEQLKSTMTPDMDTTTPPPTGPSASHTIATVLERNTDLKKTYNVLKEENEMLRKRLTSMIHWSRHNRIVVPQWWEAEKQYWQSPAAHWNLTNRTVKEMQPNFRFGPKMDLNWVHRYDPKDLGWRWTPSTTTMFYRHEGDNKYHGRMGQYDSWPPDNDAGSPDSEYWPAEKPVATTPEPAKPDWLPQPISKGHLEQYEEAKRNGNLEDYVPLWNRYR